MAAYRFFDNASVDWRAIPEPHWQQTEQRMVEQAVVLCLQDTTELDFNGQQARGLGPLSYEAQRGMYVHPTYAVMTAREPSGILNVWMSTRELREANGQRGGPKDSLRWIEGYERLAELAPRLPAARLVYWPTAKRTCCHDGAGAEVGVPGRLAGARRAQPLFAQQRQAVAVCHGRRAAGGNRVRAGRAPGCQGAYRAPAVVGTPHRTERGQGQGGDCELHRCARIRRTGRRQADRIAPADESGSHQRGGGGRIDCLVSRPLGDRNAVQCAQEALQLGTIERIERALALYLVVAWRIAHLIGMGRTCPDLDAKLFFDPTKFRPLIRSTRTGLARHRV
jgi:hypothetical protein